MAAKKRKFAPRVLAEKAANLRNRCHAEIAEIVKDGGQPGDASVLIAGNDKWCLDVLAVLGAIGLPDCRVS